MSIVASLFFEFFFLLFELSTCDEAHGNCSSDDTEYAERVSTGISGCNLRYSPVYSLPYRFESLIGCTKTWSIGHSAIKSAHHHRQVCLVVGVEEDVVACKHYTNIQQYKCCREQVECDTAFSETLEEARTNLKTDAEHE